MKRFISLLLCLCIGLSVGALPVFAAELPALDSLDRFGELIGNWWDDLELKEKFDDLDAEGLREDLGVLLKESAALDDDALAERIRETAAAHGVTLNDEQVESLLKLLRTVEKGAEVKDKAGEAKEKAGKFIDSLRGFAHKAGTFFRKLADFLQKIGKAGA